MRERIHVLENIHTAIRNEGASLRHEEEVDLCTLQEELAQKNEQIRKLQEQVSDLDVVL